MFCDYGSSSSIPIFQYPLFEPNVEKTVASSIKAMHLSMHDIGYLSRSFVVLFLW